MFNFSQVSKIVALFSFVIGTILFSLYIYFGESLVTLEVGFKFVIAAIFINLFFFFANLILAMFSYQNRIVFLKTCGIILLNIPIAIFYLYIILSIEFPSDF
jgi:hypothetical protein